MISIRKSSTELERLEDLQRVTADCYALAIRSTEEYAVEVDRSQLEQFQLDLRALEKRLRAAASAGELQSVQASFRGQLRDYRDTTREQIKKLRKDVDAATQAMETFAAGVASHGDDHQVELKRELKRLDEVSRSENLNEIRSGIGVATNKIASSFENLQRGNQLVIAQLKDEIRLLHQEIRTAKPPQPKVERDPAAWRSGIHGHIESLLAQDVPFCTLVVGVKNLKRLERQRSQAALEGAVKALLARFHGMLGPAAMIARWGEETFVAVLNPKTGNATSIAMELSRDVTRRLSGSYTVQENGRAENVTLDVAAGVVDRRAGTDPSKFFDRIGELSTKLLGQ